VSISIVCNFTILLLLLLVTNSTRPEIYFGRFNPLDHATNMMIIDVLCPLSQLIAILDIGCVFLFVYILRH